MGDGATTMVLADELEQLRIDLAAAEYDLRATRSALAASKRRERKLRRAVLGLAGRLYLCGAHEQRRNMNERAAQRFERIGCTLQDRARDASKDGGR